MTEAEIKKAINTNQAKYGNANDATKALLLAKNEGLAKQLDTLTGGKSTYDATSGRWALSGDNRDVVDKYIQQRDLVANGAYGGYDASTDPAYSALKKSILRESDRSVEDTMGAYAGMTGGIPSTAAVTAAQETANYFRGQLADQQVALGEQDYNRWLNERNADMELMNLYASEAEASAANLAALGDFSAMGKLYGWNADQIAEAQRLWLAEQQGYGGGSGGSGGGALIDEYKNPNAKVTVPALGAPANIGFFPEEVAAAVGYGNNPGTTSPGAADKKYDNRTEGQIVSMVEQYMTRNNDDASKVRTLINSGTAFTAKQKEVALAYLNQIS